MTEQFGEALRRNIACDLVVLDTSYGGDQGCITDNALTRLEQNLEALLEYALHPHAGLSGRLFAEYHQDMLQTCDLALGLLQVAQERIFVSVAKSARGFFTSAVRALK